MHALVRRARLFEDRVELTGWTLRGRYRYTLALKDIERTAWWTGEEHVNFALHLSDGKTIPLHLKKAAGVWKFEIEARLEHRRPRAPHPDAASERNASA